MSNHKGADDVLADQSLYANVFSFLGLPLGRDLAECRPDCVVMGVPYDLGTTGRPGARFGPSAIRQASAHLRWEDKRWPWTFRLADVSRCIDYGDVPFRSGDSEDMLEQVEHHARRVIDAGATLMAFGGDHLVTLPLLRAHAAVHGPLALIHFDAHTDTYEEAPEEEQGGKAGDVHYDHGCMFSHALREGLVDPARSVQIGIRTETCGQDHPFQVIDADALDRADPQAVIDAIASRVGDSPAYLTFDIDCLDPSYAPGTGTPVVGGPSTARALQVLRGLRTLNLIGFDVMEVAPAYDREQITALAAATIALDCLHLHAYRKLEQGN